MPDRDLDQRMFFVIGAPRSGTTLLMRMLNVHSEIYTRPEPHLLTPLAHLGFYDYVDKAPYDPFQSAESVRMFVDDLPNGESDYLDALRAYSDTLYGRMLEPSGRTYFLDKTPAYALVLPFIQRLYPNAVYAVLTRHPFAIFSSYAKSFFDDDWQAAHDFNPILERYVPAMAAFLRRDDVPRRAHLRYEELVSAPEEGLRRICGVAGLPYEESMIDYGAKSVEGAGLGDPIGVGKQSRPTTTSIDKWALQASGDPERIELLQRMLAVLTDDDLAVFGYTRETIWTPLEQVDSGAAERAQQQAKRWDRHHLERRLLLHLRKNIHVRPLGRVLKRTRFYCDVLLRE